MIRVEHPVVDTEATVAWKGALAGTDHTVIRVGDLDAGVAWYERVLGLVVGERTENRAYLSSPVTGRVVLGLSQGGSGLDYVSFRARTQEALAAIATRLERAGVGTWSGVDATRPGIADAVRFELPTGHVAEVLLPAGEEPPAPLDGAYRPGAIDVRTSHLQLRTTDVKGLTELLGVVGFRSSTYVQLPESDGFFIQFLRTNELHHQVAILTGQDGVHHVALEVDEVDFWRCLDTLQVQKIPAEYGPVRHHEGNMLSFYVRDPFGNRLEVTGTMEAVGFDHPATHASHEPWYHMNMWGPQPPESWHTEWM